MTPRPSRVCDAHHKESLFGSSPGRRCEGEKRRGPRSRTEVLGAGRTRYRRPGEASGLTIALRSTRWQPIRLAGLVRAPRAAGTAALGVFPRRFPTQNRENAIGITH